ncbi:lytic transglycosylase catalytic subunit [Burkholderia lata]|nr:lytic transglycosylase catalytic subunit [Burkholderia lata]
MQMLNLLLCFGLCASAAAQELQGGRIPIREMVSSGVPSTKRTGEKLARALIPAEPARARPLSLRAQRYDALIVDIAGRYGIDPLLVHAVIHTESAYQPAAMSAKGALGMMQVTPATGARFGKTALRQTRDNVEAGVAYLNWLMRRFDGRLDLMLAGYNAGEGAVARYGNTVPPYAETQAYVRKVLVHYARLSGRAPLVAGPRESASAPAAAGYRVLMAGDSLEQLVRLLIGGPPPRN